VIGTINDANYQGSASGTLVNGQSPGSITLGSLSQTYNGSAKPATATTTPSGLTVSFTYNGSATVPTGAGSYTVIGTINDANYQGSTTGTLVIGQATGSVTLGSLSQTYNGSAKAATATTTPSGLAVSFTYNGSATVPTGAGSYTVIGTINDANYQGSATGTLVIGQATGAVTLGSLSQTYDGTAKPATATTTPSGLTVTFSYNGSATIPTGAGSYTVVGTINDANYQGSATGTLVINAATLTYTANVASMTYGSAVPGLSGSVSGFVGTDNQGNATTGTLTFTAAATSSSGVGSYAINGTGLTANNGNYTFVQADGNATALTINALPVNLTGTRSYDGTTAIAAGILSVANKVGSDNVTVASGSGTLAGANVGSEAITSFETLALGGTAAGNYTLAGASGSVNITVSALALTVTNLLALDKVYDGTTNTTLDATNAGLAGVLNGDSVTLVTSNAVAYFADKNVGTNKPVTVTGLALAGAAAANYSLVDPTNVTADITAAGLTVSDVTAASKVYDGTTNAQLNGTATLNGGVSGDDVSLVAGGVSAAFAGPNVGTGIPVTVSGYAITGADAGNYTLTPPSDLAADITAATLTITAAANTKTYDGTTSASATPTTSGLQGSDTVTGLAESYDTKDAGTGKTLSVSAYTVNDGNGGNNYTVSTATSTAGVINQAPLTITASANTKTYDGSTSAAATPTVGGLQGSDTVTGLAETYDTKNVGTGKTLSVSAYTVNDGNGGNNYTVSTATSTAGVISKATLTITAAANTKIYDGSTSAAATPTTNGLQSSDSVSGLAETYDTKNAGTGKTLSVSAYTVNDGNAGGNYTVSTVASTAGVINQAAMTITAITNTKTYDGTTSAAATPTVGGLQGSDTVTGLAETYDTKNAGTGKTLSVSAYTVNDGNAGGNYTVTTVASTAGVINQATLTITASANTKTYDGSTSAAATPTANGLQSSDSVSGLAETYDTKNVGTGKTLSVSAYTVNDGNSGNNYTVSTVASTAGIINQATLTITASANTKTYDGTTSASATPTTSGLQGSDTVTGLAETYDTKNSGTGKTLSVSAYTVNDGNSGNNYTVNTAASVAGIINKATLTITAAANTKNYDGSTSAAATPTTSGLQGSDSVTGLAETYDTKNVGTGKTLSVSAYTVNDGNSGNNYTVSTVANTAGVIDQATLTITAAANTKNYDGSTSAAATPTANGLQSSDSVTGLAETYDTKNAGTGKTLSVSAYTVNDGNFGNNYTVSTVASIAGVIDPAALTVIANDKSKMCGQPNPPLTASYNGFVSGENTNVLASPVALDTPATTDSGVGTYPITAGGVAAPNYAINYVSGKLIVNPALQLSAACASVSGNNQFIVSWPTVVGQTYQLEYTSDLAAATWTPLGTPLAGTDGIVAVTNSMSVTPQCFFRVEVQ
jgi:uncharacterized protein YfiM (DUF2279 family)